ncbi:immunoglobulin-like domain-containing receptor 2 [Strigops habroptila]|uniref:immunoglobulin-like domain-containing receptor 2 n=1 Tax=Strigops habroptila TaxID=2489341 RepID=UPI0011CF7D92|nr:immunoglobulin-like domain-containing receptor 2 [Strigops habroptila]
MAAVLATLLLLGPAAALEVWVPDGRTVALLFQRVLLRCRYETAAPEPPPVVTWKFLAPCASGETIAAPQGGAAAGAAAALSCPGGARTVRIVATKQGSAVTVGDFYRGRGVTIVGGHVGWVVTSIVGLGMGWGHWGHLEDTL